MRKKTINMGADNLSSEEFFKLDGCRCPRCFKEYTLELVPSGDVGDLVEDEMFEHDLEFRCNECECRLSMKFRATQIELGPIPMECD